ncbi:hypothetical protein NX722_00110 [Endozoicomonas gorgoniicola]|uniref:Uncharacterized protein n=1 Tax=Endozoicomonas gorgoniicola TaxID=1234144 RepID=A0ABT3MNZ1_9GAMM|nr:hypothetical protein [Endozoicomonas gorgoniicola]MCW7551089.1 hypothetical protein [Endozoicomonas gorgoniicola]
MKFTIEGNDCMPPLSGGYLIILLDNKEIHVVSVPSPNIFADRHRDSISENHDEFEDPDGNGFAISVWSSNIGVEWQLDITSKNNKESLKDRIGVEYRPNDF